ncbi:MAG: type II toxin-antitoxin system RelE/ParE family toxin [Saccharofermentanales bacterium]
MAEKIAQRINELRSAPTVEMLVQYSIGRCHPLKGDRKGEYAMDLIHPFRLVFVIKDRTIQLVKITSIEDYH